MKVIQTLTEVLGTPLSLLSLFPASIVERNIAKPELQSKLFMLLISHCISQMLRSRAGTAYFFLPLAEAAST
jgi:hypothetical protein